MNKKLFILILSLLIVICLFSCYTTDLHNRYYTIKSINNGLVEFKEVEGGVYRMPTDKLRVGDKVKLRRTKNLNKVTVY